MACDLTELLALVRTDGFLNLDRIEEDVRLVESEWPECDQRSVKEFDLDDLLSTDTLPPSPLSVGGPEEVEAGGQHHGNTENDTANNQSHSNLHQPRRRKHEEESRQYVVILRFDDAKDDRSAAMFGSSKIAGRKIEREFRQLMEQKYGCRVQPSWANQRLQRSSWAFVKSNTMYGLNRAIDSVRGRWKSSYPIAVYQIARCRAIEQQRVTRRLFDAYTTANHQTCFIRVCDRATLTALFYHHDQHECRCKVGLPPSNEDVMRLFETRLRWSNIRLYHIDRNLRHDQSP